jgi:hypothetical protein
VVAIIAVLADGGVASGAHSNDSKKRVLLYTFLVLWEQSASLTCMYGYESMGALLCCRYISIYSTSSYNILALILELTIVFLCTNTLHLNDLPVEMYRM